MNSWISRNLVYRPIYTFRGERVFRYREAVRNFHKLDRTAMQERQLDKLKTLLNRVANTNEFYRQRFAGAGARLNEIRHLEDIHNFPVLDKETVNTHIKDMVSCGGPRTSDRKTSGSTGIPLHFVKDRDASAWMDAVMYEVYGWHGVRVGYRQGRFWGLPLDTKTRRQWLLKDKLLNRIRMNSFEISDETSIQYYQMLRRFQAFYLYGYPAAICEFIDATHRCGEELDDIGIKLVITTGEMLYPEQREKIERSFRCKVANEYGTTENGIIAFECPAGGMHLMSHNLIVEILDPEMLTPVKPGVPGVIVVTELHSTGMPFIRYKVGDMATQSIEDCPCGLQLPTIDRVEGRVSDMVVTPGGVKIAGPIVNYTMACGVKRLKAIQSSKHTLTILIEPDVDFSERNGVDIENKWRALVGNDMEITISIVDEIPADPAGKFRSFQSTVDS